MLDLQKLEKNVDNALANETTESLTEFIQKQREENPPSNPYRNSPNETERIVWAAVWMDDGQYYGDKCAVVSCTYDYKDARGLVFCGLRHSDCLGIMRCVLPDDFDWKTIKTEHQGFLTTKNRFVTREEAAVIAKEQGQLDVDTSYLFSEHLY
jgi:hypothetical protein